MITRQYLIELYLDWFNNYLTTEQFAIDRNWSKLHAYKMIIWGKEVYEQSLVEQKG